jgi:hypothetical protein
MVTDTYVVSSFKARTIAEPSLNVISVLKQASLGSFFKLLFQCLLLLSAVRLRLQQDRQPLSRRNKIVRPPFFTVPSAMAAVACFTACTSNISPSSTAKQLQTSPTSCPTPSPSARPNSRRASTKGHGGRRRTSESSFQSAGRWRGCKGCVRGTRGGAEKQHGEAAPSTRLRRCGHSLLFRDTSVREHKCTSYYGSIIDQPLHLLELGYNESVIARKASSIEQVGHDAVAAHSPWCTAVRFLRNDAIVEVEDKVDDIGVALALVKAGEGVEIAEGPVRGKR